MSILDLQALPLVEASPAVQHLGGSNLSIVLCVEPDMSDSKQARETLIFPEHGA